MCIILKIIRFTWFNIWLATNEDNIKKTIVLHNVLIKNTNLFLHYLILKYIQFYSKCLNSSDQFKPSNIKVVYTLQKHNL